MLEEQVQEWTRQWVEEGREQGRAEERVLLCRLTARKFDADTAGRLSGVLNGLADPERLASDGFPSSLPALDQPRHVTRAQAQPTARRERLA